MTLGIITKADCIFSLLALLDMLSLRNYGSVTRRCLSTSLKELKL